MRLESAMQRAVARLRPLFGVTGFELDQRTDRCSPLITPQIFELTPVLDSLHQRFGRSRQPILAVPRAASLIRAGFDLRGFFDCHEAVGHETRIQSNAM